MVFQTRLDKFTVVSVWNYDILFIVLYLNSKPIFDTSSFILLLLTRSLLSKKAKDMLLRQQNPKNNRKKYMLLSFNHFLVWRIPISRKSSAYPIYENMK